MMRALKIFVVSVVVFALAAFFVGYQFLTYPDRARGQAQGEVAFEIPRGASARAVARALEDAQLIENATLFRLYASQRGVASRFKAGAYQLEAPMSPRALVEALVKGAADELVSVTIPEGKTMVEVADLVSAAQVADREAFLALALNKEFASELTLPGQTVEGYLFPDTYRFRPHSDPKQVLLTMVRRHREVFEALRDKRDASLERLKKRLSWRDHDIVIMASIVEKETGQPQERPRIAQVFVNRLVKDSFQPKLLQTDPTIVYGCTVAPLFEGKRSKACEQFEGRIRRIHLTDRDNSFSTYAHVGLPPGPIANPGRAALDAVMKPDGSPYLYFVSKNDGSHKFSSTKAEHDQAVVKFQRAGRPLGK